MARIFVANSGRCGSLFLAEAFKLLTNIPSYHESVPYCIGQTSYEVNNSCRSEQTQHVLDEKIRRIKRDSSPEGNYFESNNMFIKSLAWTIADSFDDVCCIYLHRNPMDYFFSMAARNWKRGWDWILQPSWKMNILRTCKPTTYYEAVMFTWFEVRARFNYWKPLFKKTWDFDFNDINNLEEYYRMFEHLGIDYKKINKFPDDLKRNPGNNVTSRFNELGDLFRRNWEHEGVKWAYPSDIQEMLAEQGK